MGILKLDKEHLYVVINNTYHCKQSLVYMQLSQNEYITYKKPNHSENIGRVYDLHVRITMARSTNTF
jgi:hypothetical protein